MSSRNFLIYIAGKLTDKNRYKEMRNIHLATRVAMAFRRWGYSVIVPHANSYPWHDANDKMSPKEYLEEDFEIIRRCDAVVFLPNWTDSPGAIEEWGVVNSTQKPFCFLSDWTMDKMMTFCPECQAPCPLWSFREVSVSGVIYPFAHRCDCGCVFRVWGTKEKCFFYVIWKHGEKGGDL